VGLILLGSYFVEYFWHHYFFPEFVLPESFRKVVG